jgi:hypothetical protein
MGTSSTIKFYTKDKFLCAIYQQYDGYTTKVGKELKSFLRSLPFVNGIHDPREKCFNGPGCCIAQFISEFKKEPGGLYITDEKCVADYNYQVIFLHDKDFRINQIIVKVDHEKYQKIFNEVIRV